jgi:beta-lactamase superfamily II metal-dependent hydrolase
MMKILGRILFVSLAIATFVGGAFSYWAWRNARETRVIFLDVGQGDAILISRGGNQILIDGGPRGSLLLSRLSRYVPFWDRTIETVVMTHPDADHIGGFPDLLDRYRVGKVISTRAESPSETFRALDERIRNPESGIERIVATIGGREESFRAGATVLAAGAWSEGLAAALGDMSEPELAAIRSALVAVAADRRAAELARGAA